ncbi:MAG TPA: trypsin-like peptidase domain-containing protein, partial [Frankiaceae bacterium]|nr:trypsin-like peptidase domain-containing protein [Frankiaceae bacterium]
MTFGRPDDTGDPATQWPPRQPAADPYPTEVLTPLPADDAWHPTEQIWSPYEGKPRKERGPGTLIAAAAVVSALVGGAAGAGGAWYALERDDKESVRDASASLGTGTPTARDVTPGAVSSIARGVLPSVVSIDVGNGAGSGVIVRKDGYIVTNNHVVEGADDISVTLADGTTADATVVGTDPDTDLAVIKARVTGLPVAPLGRSNDLQVGDPVVAIGSPLGLAGTVTSGIISALNRSLDLPGGNGQRPLLLVNAIQTDAAINPGNSGGALANGSGQVVGISTAIATNGDVESNAGVGFAIPIDEARDIAGQLVDDGEATHSYLGVQSADSEDGVTLATVMGDGPAADAGLE